MRIIGFSNKWVKLNKHITESFTTFRFPWNNGFEFQIGDKVQLVFKPRSKDRKLLGVAKILGKDLVDCLPHATLQKGSNLSDEEAIEDGFESAKDMKDWLWGQYGSRMYTPMIKYTLMWIDRPDGQSH